MVGIYDEVERFCGVCGRKTMHETGWESEEPDVIDYWCKKCNRHTRG